MDARWCKPSAALEKDGEAQLRPIIWLTGDNYEVRLDTGHANDQNDVP